MYSMSSDIVILITHTQKLVHAEKMLKSPTDEAMKLAFSLLDSLAVSCWMSVDICVQLAPVGFKI